ncbi:NADH:ubiquinone oxidoreductase subunit NDUFA12 [Methylobacterium sp. E-041]|jgi:NADH:ubiquinone oxidoreductase subunit|uniref:NADH:ubiquinone oxidoreductase subunit NDUFA12 n=1 Tax=unclassified Methylobacterium TaxID=2615210 RepID=UPI0011C8A3CE|nr:MULTISPECIES: NADH:ubiquinone oxidoreductase subunit NDUFA12 [unclassified Methylobacterium]RZK91184.1 MAG: NADH:ubiquinone oxidoreductase subunit NDUFA12 [Methylobacterium sp.]MCJ2008316.1 NADH:ubiquinone oxidoreductase subunit NDUFA12 [Methylobacterium sp. J-092]MCJ2042248.1 NADH:ubiquinone oxidoreductase subunit NDUFA12 [Methylobacterium sp. J-059]MCJ2106402.1 NADH:ubiquinone oxidoreductase subunit NDUFA12 [Methylobacterium sp. E-041]MCJ2113764.1 NADH:ubiquinone oxidoreductase subunit ND
MALKDTLLRIFTWWNGQTMSLALYTARSGNFVGSDDHGNKYYRAQGALIDRSVGSERRWVVYNGYADASKVPPGWRGWLCHNVELPPSEEAYTPREWQKPHVENMTGTADAYRPKGSQLSWGARPAATGDYVPWTPGE